MFKHKFLTLFVALICATQLFAYDAYVDGIYYNLNTTDKTAVVTNRTGDDDARSYSGAVVIPSTITYGSQTYSVTTIGSSAFEDCRGLTSVTIPNSVTTIGDDAFSGCTSLPVTDNIRYADTYLIEAVDETLSTYTIKEGTKWIGERAFLNCFGLTSITIPNSVTTIGRSAFFQCSGLTSVTIPNSVTTIEEYAFSFCYNLTSIEIPNSVTTIGDYAFYGTGLTSVTIPNSVTTIGNNAFYWCEGLTSVTIPNSVTTIGYEAFSFCTNLTSIEIPNSVTEIGGDAFYGCWGLKKTNYTGTISDWCKIKFRDSDSNPIYSSHNLFINDVEVKDLVIPEGVTTIGSYAFFDCDLTSVTIPNSVTTIGDHAFYGTGLTSVTIPNSVTTIGRSAFSGVLNIIYSGIATGSPWGAKCVNGYVDGYLVYSDATKTKLCGCTSAATGKITIPNSVLTIGDYAFMDCYNLTSVTIPNSVTTIGNYAFYWCRGLTSVTIPNSVSTIEGGAFSYCSDLTSVEIPNSVTTIGDSAFKSCSRLTSITIPNSVTTIGDYAFEYCSNLTVTIESDFTTYQSSSFPSSTKVVYANPIATSIVDEKICSVTEKITIPPVYYDYYDKIGISTGKNSTANHIAADANGIVTITGGPFKGKNCYLYAKKGTECIYGKNAISLSTQTPTSSCSPVANQTTITISNISSSIDESVTTFSKGIYYNGTRYEADANNMVTLTGLTPNQKCTLQVYGCYNGNYYYGDSKYVTTQAFAPSLTVTESPTCVYAKGSYTHGDATILSTSVACTTTGSSVAGDEGLITGLKPNTTYSFTYSVETKEGGTYTDSKKITTSALELTTLTPKVVSAGTAIVAAETNISDYETNVGFEWRKDNAPTGAASKSSPAIICNGIMEGRLLNLGTEWWRVRPYYEDADGKRYYGKEVYIDPIDASYFEPTVHTYALATSPTVNKVQVRGYVMTGTDDVTEQGFEYWFNGSDKSPRRMPSATPDSIYRVLASGQVMTAVLEDLAYSTTYTCRAYAIAGGETYYGEEVQFLTPEDPRPIYTLTVSADENGSVNETVAGQYREGEQVTLIATPDEGYAFKEWSDGSTDNPYTVTIMSDTTLTATFEELSEGIDEVTDNQKSQVESQKFIRDGVLYIERNGKTYDAQGRKL